MIVRYTDSIKMPTLYSYFLSDFNDAALEILNNSKPFSCYHKKLQQYECTAQVLEEVLRVDRAVQDIDLVGRKDCGFVRTHEGKYGYQEDAVDFAREHYNVFVNFPQGMGKSLTTMKIIEDRKFSKTLIVCGQGNLQEEWIKDAKKHGYLDKLGFAIVGEDTGASSTKKKQWLLDNKDRKGVDLVNIEALRNEDFVKLCNEMKYNCIVVDEVQSAKGWKAEQTQGLQELERPQEQVRIALSGTPVLNNPLEFFSLCKYFGLLKDTTRTTFDKYYGVWTFDYWGHYICTGYRNLADLAELLAPVLCYVDKSELGLIPKRRKKISLPMQDIFTEYEMLRKLYRASAKKIAAAGYKSKPAIRARMRYLSSTTASKIDFVANQAKLGKALVFSQYTTVLEEYRQQLADKGFKVLYYHGALSMKERLEVLDRWHKGEADILLLSIMTARYGFNLIEASQTIFIEAPTSLGVLEQAEDRAWRIGQDKEVVSYLLSATPLDEDDLDNLVKKQEALDKLTDMYRVGN